MTEEQRQFSKEEGIIAEEEGIDDLREKEVISTSPKDWNKRKKIFVLIVVGLAGMLAPVSNTIIYPSLMDVEENLHTTEFLTNALVSVSVFFNGFAPLGWASYSDMYETRKKVYMISFAIFVITSVVCALSNNIWMLLVMRGLQSSAVSSAQCIGAGSIADIYVPTERGTAYGFFSLVIVAGPLVGPVIGGFVADYRGWRWIFWVLAIIGTLNLILLNFIPETFNKRIPSENVTSNNNNSNNNNNNNDNNNNNNNDNNDNNDNNNNNNITSNTNASDVTAATDTINTNGSPPIDTQRKRFNPFAPLYMLKYPNVILLNAYTSILFGMIYIISPTIPRNFKDAYGLSVSKAGLVYISLGIGHVAGSAVGGRLSDIMLIRFKKRHGGKIVSEQRLHGVWFGSVIIPSAYFAYGWLMEQKVFMAWPIAAIFFGGFGMMVVYSTTSTYFLDSYPRQSASVISTHVFLRSIVAGIMSLFAVTLQDALGLGWTYTSLAIISLLGISNVIIVYLKGGEWRAKLESEIN